MSGKETVHISKPIIVGENQMIHIPETYRLDGPVVISKTGDALMITPHSALERRFFEGIGMLTEDFLAEGRPEEIPGRVQY